jgi:hypothetical protein
MGPAVMCQLSLSVNDDGCRHSIVNNPGEEDLPLAFKVSVVVPSTERKRPSAFKGPQG